MKFKITKRIFPMGENGIPDWRQEPEVVHEEIDLSGYRFLGWQNGWKHVYFDEDGNVTTGGQGEKPKKSFGYLSKDYPEYCACVDAGHKRRESQRTRSGSENVVWCDTCKHYWKYDSSG